MKMAADLGRQYGKLYLSGRSDRITQLAHISLLDGKNNAYLGLYAGAQRPLAGGNNTFVGSFSGANASSEAGVFVGLGSGRRATRIKETCFLGYKCGELAERVEASVCIGAYAGRKMTRANCNTLLGYQAGAELTSGSRNTIIGSYAAFQQFNGSDNVCIGHRSGYRNTIGANNTYVGTNAGFAAYAGYENVCMGVSSGEELYAGSKNVLLGYAAGSRIADASNCIAIGTRAMQFFSLGDTNTCLGTETAKYFSGNNNTILGGYSVSNATGSFNSVVGSRSLNRRNGGRVQIDRCVVLGEHVEFDVPVRPITLQYPNAVVKSSFTVDPNAANIQLSDSFVGNSRVLFGMDTAPVGASLFQFERATTLTGTFWTLGPGEYDLSWGLQVSNVAQIATASYDFIPPAPYSLKISNDGFLTVYIDGNEAGNASYTVNQRLEVIVEQTSQPPQLVVKYRDGTDVGIAGPYMQFAADGDITLPGTFAYLAESTAVVNANGIATIDTVGMHKIPPGGQIYILGATQTEFNGKWSVRDATAQTLDIDIGLGLGTYDLGTQAKVYLSRARKVTDVMFNAVGTTVTMTGSHTLRSGDSFWLVDSEEADGVYDVTAKMSPTDVTFSIAPSAVIGPNANIWVSLFEPDLSYAEFTAQGIVGTSYVTHPTVTFNRRADAEFVTNSIIGPSTTDGHVWVGPAGSQALMDANIRNQQLEFSSGGYSYARYGLGTDNTLLRAQGTFRLYPNLEFGVEWLTSYKLQCVFTNTGIFDIRALYGLANLAGTLVLAEVTEDEVSGVSGNVAGNSLPMDLSNVFLTKDPWVTVSVEEIFNEDAAQLGFTITAQGGPLGWLENKDPPDITEFIQFNITNTLLPDPQGASLRYYANNFTVLRDISVYNERYRDTPEFSDVIYLGSNHTISQPADWSNVWITSLGDTRILRANQDEFRVFSDVTNANALQCDGFTISNASSRLYSMTINGSYTIDEIPEVVPGNALHVKGNALYSGAILFDNGNVQTWQCSPDTGATPAFLVYNRNGTGTYLAWGATTWSAHSDRRMKKNVKDLEYGLDVIGKLRPVRYDYVTDAGNASSRLGFIAQDVLPHVPEAVNGAEDTIYGLSAADLIPAMVNAIKELRADLAALKASA
jgi:hypothetical protein